MKSLLHQLNPWWESEFKPDILDRPKYSSRLKELTDIKDVIFLTGLRRIGKTTLLKQHIQHLLSMNLDPKTIVYISLDLLPFNDMSIQDIVTKVREIHGFKTDKKLYLFLDEVTYKDNFRQEIKNIYDLDVDKVFASASSATLLVDHTAFLTGRSRTVVVEPLDFSEFLLFKRYEVKQSDSHLYRSYFDEYMKFGGIPEYVLTGDVSYVANLVENILMKDVVAVHGLKKPALVKELFRLLCERSGKLVSYNKLAKIVGLSNDSVKEYISLFEKSFLFSIVEKEGKLNQRILESKKIYCVDVGIRNVTVGFRDKGAVFENLVFNKIKRDNPRFLIIKGIELDFVFKDTLIEAKFNSILEGKQKDCFDKYKIRDKLLVTDYSFFLD